MRGQVGKLSGSGRHCYKAQLLLICKDYRFADMNENVTRKGERTKKPPKYMQYDDADYGHFGPPRTLDQKEKLASSAQTNQIAKLLHKFLNSINQKLRDYRQGENAEKSSNDQENGFQFEAKKENIEQSFDRNSLKAGGMQNGGTKKVRESNGCSGVQGKGGKGEGKKTAGNGRSQGNISSSIQADLDYHTMINEHIRSAYPHINNLSPDMLKSLDIPKQLFDHHPPPKGKSKDDRTKNNQILKNARTSKDSKEELKPFKRQSYHVAIAYHIHLKRLKSNSAEKDIDPTSAARKLRDQQGKDK